MKMSYVLCAALAAGAAVGGAQSLAGSPPSVTLTTPSPPLAAHAAEVPAPDRPAAEEPSAAAAIDGEVLEAIQVPNYSYLRLGEKGTAGTWVAVPTASLGVGDPARVRDAMKMTGFASTVLKRTFPVIYFGTLEGGRPAHGMIPGLDAHAPPAVPGAAPVQHVDRAQGPTGKTVAELIAQRTQLAGKTVRIRATVVKSTPGILGRTYLHLRDGSGDATAGTHDVAATTEATPAVGEIIVVEGVVAIDRDLGSGYKFPTIVENARILVTP